MSSFPPSMQRLIRELSRLPSVGERSATRLAYHIVSNDRKLGDGVAKAIQEAIGKINLCQNCFFLTEEPVCSVCRDESRDRSFICVVEKPMDLVAIERVGEYRGRYHVLHGAMAPLRGVGPSDIRIDELMIRLDMDKIKEVILATSSTVEGDATALYIGKLVGGKGIKSTRLAQGMPKGGELEFADDVTLSRAFNGRQMITA